MHLLFLLVPILRVTARITLFDEYTSVASIPTFDFFEYQSNPYNITGIACSIPLIKDPETQLCKVAELPALESNEFTESFQQTVMYAKFAEARECNIDTISQLFEKAHEMLPLLAKAGYPPSKTLVIFTGEHYKGVIGCPTKEPYTSHKIFVSDASPPSTVNVAIAGGHQVSQFLKALDETKPYAFKVVQETDPWNAIFLSFGYNFFKWCSVALYAAAVVAALKTIFENQGKGAIVMNVQNMIFWMAVLAAIGNFNYTNP